MKCFEEGCDEEGVRLKKTLCETHYRRKRRTEPISRNWRQGVGICIQCEEILEGKRYGTLYCSQRCATRHSRGISEEPLTCPMCFSERNARSDAIYCSRKCLLRASNLRNNYGLTPEQYYQLLDEFENRCYICKATKDLVVDHCHDSGKVRGILCHACNQGLGMFKDNKSRMIDAAIYLSVFAEGFVKQS